MSKETLLSAARRVVRFILIDNTSGGGLLSNETAGAVEILDAQVRLAAEAERPTPEQQAQLDTEFAAQAEAHERRAYERLKKKFELNG